MPVHSQVIFPRELTDDVLANLLGDYTSLNSCALVCRDWKTPSQRVLFRSVKFEQVKMKTSERNMTALINALQENPQLATLVREICLQWCKVSVINFLNHVPHLPMVEHLVLKHISFISWSEEAVEAPQKILALPTLKKLDLFDTTFEDMSQLLKVFVTCGVNVDTLRLHRLSIIKAKSIWSSYRDIDSLDDEGPSKEADEEHSSPGSDQPAEGAPKAKLRTLDITRGSPSMIASWMSKKDSPFDLSKLESLRYEEDVLNPQFGALNRLLTNCQESLEHLEIYCPRGMHFTCFTELGKLMAPLRYREEKQRRYQHREIAQPQNTRHLGYRSIFLSERHPIPVTIQFRQRD